MMCAASSLHRGTMSVSNVIGGTGNSAQRRPVKSAMLALGGMSYGMAWHVMYRRSPAPVWHGMVWYGMVDVCDGYLAAEASSELVKIINLFLLREFFRVLFAQTPPLQLPVAEPLDPHAS